MAIRINKHVTPRAHQEFIGVKDLPIVGDGEEEKALQARSERIAAAYREVAPVYHCDIKCNIASAVASYFLRHGMPPDYRGGHRARIASFLFIGENPRLPLDERAQAHEDVMRVADMPVNTRNRAFKELGTDIGETRAGRMMAHQIHHATLVPRKDFDGKGRFNYVDLTYHQFGREGLEGPLVFDAVSSKTMRDKYLLIPLSPEESRITNIHAAHMVSGEPLDPVESYDEVHMKALGKMMDRNREQYDRFMAGVDSDFERNKRNTRKAQAIIRKMTKLFQEGRH